MTRYTQEDTLSTYLDLGRNSAIIFIADHALYTSIYFFDILEHKYYAITGNRRQLVVVRRICCCSQFMIFLLELLGQAIGCLAGPSSSNRKIMD